MSLHAEENHSAPETASGRVTLFLFGLGVATFICGVWSFFGIGPSGPQCHLELESIWTRVYRLLALFEFSEVNVQIGECYIGWQIEVARFTGPFATIVLVVRVLMEILRGPLERLRLQRFKGHTVIVGFGEKGKVRAIEAASGGVQVVAIDNAPGEASHAVAARYGIVLLVGDALAPGGTRQRGSLSRVRLRHARRFVVATGDDSRNLSIAQIIAAQVRREPGADREIEVSLGDPLIRRALGADADDGLIDAFAIEDSAAFWLCESARFFAVADLLGQRRLHIVILGFDRLGVSLTAQILRSSQTADLGVARITVLSASTTDARALLLSSYPGIEAVAEIAYIAADPRGGAIDVNLMAEIEAASPITAVVVLGDRSAETLPIALAVRDASRRTGRWMAAYARLCERSVAAVRGLASAGG